MNTDNAGNGTKLLLSFWWGIIVLTLSQAYMKHDYERTKLEVKAKIIQANPEFLDAPEEPKERKKR